MPGHSFGQVCYYEPKQRILFSGDHILPGVTPNPVIELEARRRNGYKSLKTYLRSLAAAKALDVQLVCPGHGKPFGPANPRIDAIMEHHNERKRLILNILGDRQVSKWALCTELFPELEDRQAFLGLSEIEGHLEVLEEEGLVGENKRHGRLLFYRL
jgi:glyoxylase-like metal-dependent hydrolase (beta-lactamase superfamily II)